jgi:acyl-[acyl-carrier-protein] desaturase
MGGGMKLQATLDDLYQRHLEHTARADWNYEALLPWERGRNFTLQPWAADQGSLTPELALAVETALLTEINLPWFTAGLKQVFEVGPAPLRSFVRTWTAEEDQHSRILDVYLALSRNGDPVRRAALRKQVVKQGYEIQGDSVLAVMVYTTLQELATRVFYQHLATASEQQDPALTHILRAVAKDETLHYVFYRDAVAAYLAEDPSRLETVCTVVMGFRMPGAEMPDFGSRLTTIARVGGYGPQEYLDDVLFPVLRHWHVFEHEGSGSAEGARGQLTRHMERLQHVARRYQQD